MVDLFVDVPRSQIVEQLQMRSQLLWRAKDDHQEITVLLAINTDTLIGQQEALKCCQAPSYGQHKDNLVRRRCQQIAGHGEVAAQAGNAALQEITQQTCRRQSLNEIFFTVISTQVITIVKNILSCTNGDVPY